MSSKFKLTPAQQKAIDLRDHTMLVSAAAGSGKTAVLTKRIIKLITDSDNPTDVSELLVVTFTKAAATELKERISAAIYDALKADPTNKHLSNQLLKLGKAKICTIHSFCADLVKSNFQVLGLSANLRIADETEARLIQNNVSNELIDSFYGGLYLDKVSDFADFTENFLSAKKDDSLPDIFSNIYNRLRAYPVGIDLLKKCANELEGKIYDNILDTKWGMKIKEYIRRTYTDLLDKYDAACSYFESDEVFAKSYLPAFEADRRICFEILQTLEKNMYNELYTCFNNQAKAKLGNVKKELQNEKTDAFKKIRETLWKSTTIRLAPKLFSFSEESVKEQLKKTAEVCRNMYGFLEVFDFTYKKEKKDKGLLDYNDLENYAIKLLYKDNTCEEITDLAQSIKAKYKYIFIDEYQDVNELQDKIFCAVSTPTNRFMVGDIKQSIYGFRGSEPELFSNYRTNFPICSPDEDRCPTSDGVTLYLSNNFRSDRTVIDFSNAVFEVLFNNNSGKAPYTEGDRLVCSKLYAEDEQDYNVRLCFMEDDEEVKGYVREAEFVADEIEKLIKEGTEPSDIAILFRYRNNSVFFEEALKKRGIESFNQVDKDFFENDAVLLMLCLLNAVDNPSRDIYLAGVLKSPIFGFDMTDITKIRRYERQGSLYDALKKYEKETEDKKCAYFLEKLKQWRKYAEGCPVDKFVRYIYNETHILELLSGKKKDRDIERQSNLLLLYEYARSFENGSFKGLYNFILYLNDMIEKQIHLPCARLTSEGKGVVNIMTVHNSKGLEFNTVFFSGTSCKFNRMDERNSYILHKDYGLTLKLRDKSSFGKYNTYPRIAAEIAIREDDTDEEIRALYVALTRAKKRLIVTSCIKKAKEVIERISSEETKVSHNALLNVSNVIELLLYGILKSDYKEYSIEYISPCRNEEESEKTIDEYNFNEQLIDMYEKQLEEKFSYEYPYKELTVLPSKLAVSKLYPGVLDEYTKEIETSAPSMYSKPKFLSDEENKATGAEKGTANHVFMQFCDFENVEKNGVEKELERLFEKGFIDKRNASLVNVCSIKKFFENDLYSSLKKAKNIWRERRFNIKLPAVKFTQDTDMKNVLQNESVLVQGVIDLLFVDNDGKYVLVDYKTDWFNDKDIESGNAEKILIERHKMQLTYYAEACKILFGKEIDSIIIYSFALGKCIKIK